MHARVFSSRVERRCVDHVSARSAADDDGAHDEDDSRSTTETVLDPCSRAGHGVHVEERRDDGGHTHENHDGGRSDDVLLVSVFRDVFEVDDDVGRPAEPTELAPFEGALDVETLDGSLVLPDAHELESGSDDHDDDRDGDDGDECGDEFYKTPGQTLCLGISEEELIHAIETDDGIADDAEGWLGALLSDA